MVLYTYKGEKVTAGLVDSAIREIFPNSEGFVLRGNNIAVEKWKVTGIVASSTLTNSIVGVALQKGANLILCLESGLHGFDSILENAKILEVCYKNDLLVYEIGAPWSLNRETFISLISRIIDNSDVSIFSVPSISIGHIVFNSAVPLPFFGLFGRLVPGSISFSQKSIKDHECKRILMIENPVSLKLFKNMNIDSILTFQLTPKLIEFSKKNKILSLVLNYSHFLNELLRFLILMIADSLGAEIIPVFENTSAFRVI